MELEMLTADTITNSQIARLRDEAASAGDQLQVLLCDTATNPASEQKARLNALAKCAAAINAARAAQ